MPTDEDGHVFVAGIHTHVSVFKLNNSLSQICSLGGFIASICTEVRGNKVLVGDLMKSVTLLEFDGKELIELTRDHNSNWVNDCMFLDDENYLLGDSDCNLITLKREEEENAAKRFKFMNTIGEFHLGESVNRFRQGIKRGTF
jgi:DNA damage-binding protein 1